jgi:hypothetical protein
MKETVNNYPELYQNCLFLQHFLLLAAAVSL